MERILPETIPPIDSPIETPVPDATVYPTASQVAGAAPRAPPWPMVDHAMVGRSYRKWGGHIVYTLVN